MAMLKTIEGANLSGKKVILRADLDVPIAEGEVKDDYRLQALLPTLKYLLGRKAKVLVVGHVGRPEGKRDLQFSLRPITTHLSRLLGEEITFVKDINSEAKFSLMMLENLRFWPGEEKNNSAFAKKLASRGDIFVNEAFAASHREHASIVGLAEHLPSYVGLHFAQEVKELGGVLENPDRPLIFILGGAKTETKVSLVKDFAKVADRILLGGLLMFHNELEGIPKVLFPVDAVETYDIGPKSIKLFLEEIGRARTIVWNGPLGKWEDKPYSRSTQVIAGELAKADARTVVGGGDTIAALSAFGHLEGMDYISLGGGAMLEFLAGKKLPGLEALGYY